MYEASSDREEIQRIIAGDEAACRRFVLRWEPLVARVANGMLGVGDEADDVGQEAFIRAFRALPKFRGDADLSTWLTRIVMNLAFDALQRRQRRSRWVRLTGERADDALGLEAAAPENDADSSEAVRKAVAELDPPHRAVVVLRLLEQRSVKDTAAILAIPEGTVMSRLKRALARLEPVLRPWWHQ